MTIRLRNKQQEGKDYTQTQTVVGEMGYQYHFGPNESRVLPDHEKTLASNATVKLGTDEQQAVAPEVVADVDDDPVGLT